MKNAYKFEKISENGHWIYYCTTHDLPRIIKLKNDKFKVEAGKESRIEDDWESAVKYAVSYEKRWRKPLKNGKKRIANEIIRKIQKWFY